MLRVLFLTVATSSPMTVVPPSADPGPVDPISEPRRAAVMPVRIEFDPQRLGFNASELGDGLAAHLGDLDLVFELRPGVEPATPRPDPSSSTVHVWLVRAEAGDLVIHLWRPSHSQPWTRRLPHDVEPDLLLESIGVVLRGMLTAESTPRRDSFVDEPPPATVEPLVVTTQVPRVHHLDGGLAYRGESFAPELPWHHGLWLGMTWGSPMGMVVELSTGWVPPHSVGSMIVQRIPVELAVGGRWRRTKRVRPAVLGFLSAEMLGWSGARPGARALPGWAPRFGVGLAMDSTVELGRGMFGFMRVGIRAWPVGAELVVEAPDGLSPVLRANSVSAGGLIGVGVHLFSIRNRGVVATPFTNE